MTEYDSCLSLRSRPVIIKRILLQTYWYFKKRNTGRMGKYHLTEDIKYLIRIHWRLRNLHKTMPLTNIKGDFVLFPLHMEPELALGTFSPEFNDQRALILMVAKNLPAGVRLVVKEHIYAMGSRPGYFYKEIGAIPNVLFISPLVNALEIAKKSKAVVVITGTIGTESAMAGVPIISFGLHNKFNFLPNVHVVKSWLELRPLLLKLVKGDK